MISHKPVRRIQCKICTQKFPSRDAFTNHLVATHPGDPEVQDTILTVGDRRICGQCGKESSEEGIKQHLVDKRDDDHSHVQTLTDVATFDWNHPDTYIHGTTSEHKCIICNKVASSETALASLACKPSPATQSPPSKLPIETDLDTDTFPQPSLTTFPDAMAETLIQTSTEYVLIRVCNGTVSVPDDAYTSSTHDVSISSFYAQLGLQAAEDQGLLFTGFLKISPQVAKHLQIHTAGGQNNEPIRLLELVSSRNEHHRNTSTGYKNATADDILSALPLKQDGPYYEDLAEAASNGYTVSPLRPLRIVIEYPISEPRYQSYSPTYDRHSIGKVAALEPVPQSAVPGYARVETTDRQSELETPYISPLDSHPTIGWESLSPLSPTQELFELLDGVNKHAKREAQTATNCYNSGNKAHAKLHSVRKTALYAVKSVAIHKLIKDNSASVTAELHTIDGNLFWCFYFDDFDQSFHQPVDAVADEAIQSLRQSGGTVTETPTPIELHDSPKSDLPDRQPVLTKLKTAYGIDVNEYLTQDTVTESTGHYQFDRETHSTEFSVESTTQQPANADQD